MSNLFKNVKFDKTQVNKDSRWNLNQILKFVDYCIENKKTASPQTILCYVQNFQYYNKKENKMQDLSLLSRRKLKRILNQLLPKGGKINPSEILPIKTKEKEDHRQIPNNMNGLRKSINAIKKLDDELYKAIILFSYLNITTNELTNLKIKHFVYLDQPFNSYFLYFRKEKSKREKYIQVPNFLFNEISQNKKSEDYCIAWRKSGTLCNYLNSFCKKTNISHFTLTSLQNVNLGSAVDTLLPLSPLKNTGILHQDINNQIRKNDDPIFSERICKQIINYEEFEKCISKLKLEGKICAEIPYVLEKNLIPNRLKRKRIFKGKSRMNIIENSPDLVQEINKWETYNSQIPFQSKRMRITLPSFYKKEGDSAFFQIESESSFTNRKIHHSNLLKMNIEQIKESITKVAALAEIKRQHNKNKLRGTENKMITENKKCFVCLKVEICKNIYCWLCEGTAHFDCLLKDPDNLTSYEKLGGFIDNKPVDWICNKCNQNIEKKEKAKLHGNFHFWPYMFHPSSFKFDEAVSRFVVNDKFIIHEELQITEG